MTAPDRNSFRKLEEAFNAALDLDDGPERDSYVSDLCSTDPARGQELRELLSGWRHVVEAGSTTSESLPRFGAWQAIRILGHGGMGMVYLAERADGAFQMSAAVKIVPLAVASREIEERFLKERQFLAMLDHPGISRLIDGGVSHLGVPFLVMEFIDGEPVDRYAEHHSLSTRDRVALVRQIMAALAYVHSQRVLHRDLKPSNILVDPQGRVKLLDFGIARLMNSDVAGGAVTTNAFTPEYASPEQIHGRPLTFAADIYSAGVLLRRMIQELDRPLEAIVSKAVRENPEERYASAEEMDADLARYVEGRPVQARRPHYWKWIAIAAAVLAIVAASIWALRKPAVPPSPSIAVLPFANVGGNPANQYFSDGLTGEITDSLTRLKGLRVIAKSSAFQLRGKTNDLREIGRQLHVTHVLEGSVERSGDEVKIVARLERVSDVSQVWSNTYRRKGSNVFSVQSELAAGLAANLGATLGVANPARHVVQDAEARDAYMRGYYEMQAGTPAAYDRAEADFKQAIARDPRYAQAYATLGSVIWGRLHATFGGAHTQAVREEAENLWHRALDLDPELGTARAALALNALQYDWDWTGAEREFQSALASGPNADADQDYALLLIYRGRFAEAEDHLRRAQSLNPLSSRQIGNLGLARFLEGRFGESRGELERVVALYPNALAASVGIAIVDIEQGRTDTAFGEFKKLEPQFAGAPLYEAMALARAGRKQEALRLIRPLEEKPLNESIAMQWFALVYGFMGDEANTVKWLERSAGRREFQALNLAVNPTFRGMQNSPGFHALKKRMGLER